MVRASRAVVVLIVTLLGTAPRALAVFATWTSTTTATIGQANLTLTGLTADGRSLADFDLSSPPFAAAPGNSSQQALNFFSADSWNATFDQTLTNFKLYVIYWRGDGGGGPDPVRYAFNRPFTIASGLSGASVSGNALLLPANDLYEGVLQFTGSFSSLACTTTASVQNQQALTLNASLVPEPAGVALAFVIFGAATVRRPTPRIR